MIKCLKSNEPVPCTTMGLFDPQPSLRRTTIRTEAEEVDSANGLRYLSSQVLKRIRNSKKITRATKVVFNQPAVFLSLRFAGPRTGAHNPFETGMV